MSFFVFLVHLCVFIHVTPPLLRPRNSKLLLMVSERCKFKHSIKSLHCYSQVEIFLIGKWVKNLPDVIFPFSQASLSLYSCDTAAFSASEYKTILYRFLKNARLSPALDLDTRNSSVEFFPSWTVA